VFELKKESDSLHLKKKRELMKNEKLHLERSSVKNQEKEEEGEGGLHVALSPPLLLGNRSSS